MKRLLIAIAAAAMTMFAPAAVTNQLGFEGAADGGTPYGSGVSAPETANYPFAGFGDKYLALDDTFSAQGAGGTVFDMYVQFKPLTEEPAELADGAKLAVYAGTDGMIHVLTTNGNYRTEGTVDADTWTRLTIVEAEGGYKVYANYAGEDVLLAAEGIGNIFPADTGATTVEFTGSGKLDNFVARTTDPFYSGEYAASTGDGNEKYATYSDALADVLSSGATDAIAIAGETPRIVDGTAANPYEITNLADLKALQAAVAAGKGADKCYVQTADIALDAAWPGIGIQNGKDIVSTAAFDKGAFKGTYDGGDFTVSNFQMIDGLDYCGFFNSVSNATIRNLKISYKDGLFAKDMAAANEACGATFVGVAKGSTLQGLTSLAGTVSCTKGFGGIVGYLMAGSTVDSCTNNVNMTSLANNKCGGIAMIRQGGSGSAVIRNCQNNGTVTTGSTNGEFGGIVGYVGDDITIADCESIVAYKFFHRQKRKDNSVPVVTMSGVNKGNATTVPAYTSVPGDALVTGLNFATVDGNVATFVADNALALNGAYKVMASGATATYAFTDLGSISFDTSLATPTYAITAANPNMFDVTSATEEDVTTYTAAGGTAVASITKDETTTQFNTVAKALTAAESGDIVVLLADNTVAITIPAGVTVDCDEFANTGAIDGAGAIKLNAAPATALAFDASWTGTAKICWDPGSKQKFVFNDFGNANSIVEIVGANNAFNAFPSTTMGSDASAPTINPAIVLSCNWTITDGWKGTTTTIPKLSGTGNLTINDTYLRYYSIGTVDGYSGTITTGKHIVKYGNIVNTGAGFDTCLVKAGATFAYDLTDAQLNGAATALAVGTVNEQKGIYLARATVNDAGYMTVAEAITAANTDKVSSVTVYDGSSAAFEGWSYDNGVYSRYIAKVGETSYTTLAAAIAAADEGETKTVELLYTCGESVTIPAGVTVNSLTTANDFHGTIAGAGTLYYAQTPSAAPTATDDFTGEVVIGYNWSSNANLKWYGGSNSTITVTSFTGNNTYLPNSDVISKVRVASGGTVSINNGNPLSANELAWDHARVIQMPALKVDGTLKFEKATISGAGSKVWNLGYVAYYYANVLDASGVGSIEVGTQFALRIDAVDFAAAPTGTDRLVPLSLTNNGDSGKDAGALYGPNGVAGEQIPVTVNGVATEQTLVYDADKGGLVLYVAPTPKAAEVVDGEQYETLAEAIAAANAGDTVRLLSDATLAAMVTLEKNLTLDLNGFTLGEDGDTKSLFSIINGATLTVNGSVSTYCIGRFNVGAKNTSGNLVLNNGYYMVGDGQTVIHVNGLCTASTVTVTGATIVSPTDNGVQFNGTGTYVLNNATVLGATAVYMKAGSLALNGTTSLNATGDKKAVTENNNGSDATGDALVLDSCTPPYAAITGVTVAATVRFTSANGSAVLAYARTGNTRVTKVLPKNVTISEAVATESDLFVGGSIDPTAATKTTEVEAVDAPAAIEAVTVDVPRSISTNTGVTAEQYKSYFKYVATPVEGKEGVYEVELVGLADEVQADADADAMDVLNGNAVAVTMKPGLYYGVSAVTSLTDAGIAKPQHSMLGGANGATKLNVSKPGTTQGFIKVWISTQTIQ